MIVPLLEVIYKEVDISKNHVYMAVNILIILSQEFKFETKIRVVQVEKVPWYKETSLATMPLASLITLIMLRTIQLNLSKLREPHIFNNCIAALCNLTIASNTTAPSAVAKATTPLSPNAKQVVSPPVSPSTREATPPTTFHLHAICAQRTITVLGLLVKKFIALQSAYEAQIKREEENALAQQAATTEEELADLQQEAAEAAEHDVSTELGTCMDFLTIFLDIVNRCLHSSSFTANPHTIYWLIHEKASFVQLTNYTHIFEAGYINNIMNVIQYFEKRLNPKETNPNTVMSIIDRESKNCSQEELVMNNSITERGKYSYHEQSNSFEFFVTYVLTLAQQNRFLPQTNNNNTEEQHNYIYDEQLYQDYVENGVDPSELTDPNMNEDDTAAQLAAMQLASQSKHKLQLPLPAHPTVEHKMLEVPGSVEHTVIPVSRSRRGSFGPEGDVEGGGLKAHTSISIGPTPSHTPGPSQTTSPVGHRVAMK